MYERVKRGMWIVTEESMSRGVNPDLPISTIFVKEKLVTYGLFVLKRSSYEIYD